MSDDVIEQPAPVRVRRPSRFDRPKPPHDWRWALSTLGKVLIVIGLLMFGFVAYQLWGTGIQTAAAQNRLENKFEDLLASTTTATLPPTTVPVTTPSTTTPATPTEPSAPPATPDTSTTLPPPAIVAPPEGDPLARLEIPSIGIDWITIEGVSSTALQDGPGHFPETPLPGQVGNSAIAGHRTTFGQPFYRINNVDVGDPIIVTTLAGRYTYVVTGQVIVGPSAYGDVIPARDPAKATLTLISCHPRYSADQRIVIFAELDPSQSSPITAAAPLTEPPPTDPTLPGESPSTAPSDETVDPTDDSVTDVSVAAPADTTATSEPTVSTATTDGRGDQGAELFAGGWFSDPDAFPQVALWGFIVALVLLGAYGLSRRTRRVWVGALVGVLPFLLTLYFFYENVNRLLPPSL